jgi:hypothetical protein
VQQRGYDGMVEDAQRLARRRPGVFLAGAAVAGFAIGRLLRSAKDGDNAESDTPALPQTTSATLPRTTSSTSPTVVSPAQARP